MNEHGETGRGFSVAGTVVDLLENVFDVEVDADQQVVEQVFNFEVAGFATFEDGILHFRWLSKYGIEMNITVIKEEIQDSEVVRLQAYTVGGEEPNDFSIASLSRITHPYELGDSAVTFVGSNLEGEEAHLRVSPNGFEYVGVEPIQLIAA